MATAYLRLDILVRFRAFNITFGTVKDSVTFPLTGEVGLVAALLGPRLQGGYHAHGVNVDASLVPAP